MCSLHSNKLIIYKVHSLAKCCGIKSLRKKKNTEVTPLHHISPYSTFSCNSMIHRVLFHT